MKRFILALAVMATPAFAQNVTVFVVQKDGGIIQRTSNLTLAEAALMFGRDPAPEGATGVVLERNEPPRWTDQSAGDVDKEYGGDGTPIVGLFPKLEDERDSKVINLFPEEAASADAIKPRAGEVVLVFRPVRGLVKMDQGFI